ncbi:MAG: 4a-hydroxytetrahydrobiopterin dehydratase [Thermoleophilaceae bacterium]|nr:4a-hydroxytetrahydrobiopterin dehydratase [Thermoleophilaceae bacterium]
MPLLSDEEIGSRLRDRRGWERQDDAIARVFETADFVGSVDLVNRIAPVAEEMNHHPDVSISWNRVTVSLSTHSQGGLTDSDFALAERIDELA